MNSFVSEDGVLKKYVGINTNVTIPDGVTSIGAWALCDLSEMWGTDEWWNL